MRAVLQNAVEDYADDALSASVEVFAVAKASGPLVDTFSGQQRYQKSYDRCQQAMQALSMITYGILNLEETTDPECDDANEEYKFEVINQDKVSSILEGARQRMHMASHAIPDGATPGTRLNGDIYTYQNTEDGGPEEGETT